MRWRCSLRLDQPEYFSQSTLPSPHIICRSQRVQPQLICPCISHRSTLAVPLTSPPSLDAVQAQARGGSFAEVVARASLAKDLQFRRSSHLGRTHRQKRDSMRGEEQRNSIKSELQCSAVEPCAIATDLSGLKPFSCTAQRVPLPHGTLPLVQRSIASINRKVTVAAFRKSSVPEGYDG